MDNKIINIEMESETTFDKLKNLQILLKKESALKGLYIETDNNTRKDIETLSREIYKKKIEVLNALKNDPDSNNIYNYQLVEDNKEYLKILYLYIPKFLSYFWEKPSIFTKLLIHLNQGDKTDKLDIKSYLAPLICNNFYENILSSNYIEDQLVYIIYILLGEEIKQLNNINDYKKFLNNTVCGYLLDELIDKKDIKAFFKIILMDAIENLEISSGESELLFDACRIEQALIDRKNSLKKSIKRKTSTASNNSINNSIKFDSQRPSNEEEIKNHEFFYSTYLFNNYLFLTILKRKKDEYISKNNRVMEEYINLQINGQTNEEIYSNNQFLSIMNDYQNTHEILKEYEKNFIKVINFINSLIKSILENIDLLPYSIRIICKIISSLLEKKFKGINLIQKNMFISQFFLNKLFIPMLSNPTSEAFINNYIISNNTLHNLQTISQFISQFFSFQLFSSDKDSMNSPFNLYFFENIDKLIKVYEHLTIVKLPTFIEKLINKEISKENFEFDYFKENNNEILFHRTAFLTVNHIKILLKYAQKLKQIIFNKDNKEIQIIISKLEENQEFLDNLCAENELKVKKIIKADKSKGKKKEEKKEQTIKYLLFSDLLYNKKYKKLFSVDREHSYFKLEEKKINDSEDNKNNKELNRNLIIKTKNVISTLLYNYRTLVETDFQEGEINNTLDIFKQLRLFMKSSDFVIDDRIPSDWYLELLFEYLKKLPQEYKDNDYDKLYQELKKDIEKSMKQYNFEELSIIIDKKKFGKKKKAYYNNIIDILQDIKLNNSVNKIIEKEQINVKLFFRYTDEKKELNIFKEDMRDKQLDFLDSFIFVDPNKKAKLCKTISKFIQNFPNFNRYIPIISDTKTIFDIQKELNVPKQLSIFFNILKNNLKANQYKDEKELNIIYDKLYDYVMSKLYFKIYPFDEDCEDISLNEKILEYSWIEPNNLMKRNYNYNFELVLPEITKYFNLIDIEKSPRKKILNLNKIFGSINNLLNFSQNQKLIGIDDQMPLFHYIFLKSKPKNMLSNYKFMVLYNEEKIKKNEGNYLAQLNSIIQFTVNLKSHDLLNISDKEFNKNCRLSIIENSK